MSTEDWDAASFLEKVLGVVPGVIYVFNQKTQSSEYTNRSLGDMLGYTGAEAQAMGEALIPTLTHPDDLPRVSAHFSALQQLQDGEIRMVEYRMQHKDGRWVWLVSHDAVFDRADDGTVLRHIGIATDITEQKAQEARAAAIRDELETIFNAATSGIVALDSAGQVVRVNNRARHMLGGISDPTPFAWPKAIQFLDAETMKPLEASADPLRRAMSGNRLRSETHLMRRVQSGQDQRYVRVDNALVDNPASGIHVVLVIDDVSNEERNRQVVERKSRLDALGQLTGGIAHDFNNLLASQLYAVDLARNARDDAKRDMYLETAANSVQRGRALTSRLLSFARRQPGLSSVKLTSDVLGDFQQLVRPMLEAQIDIEVSIEDRDLRHYCDQVQLETALMNLVLNSRDAMLRAGKGNRIDIKARPVRSPTAVLDGKQSGSDSSAGSGHGDGPTFRYIEVSVADNGPGMDDETLARCTDPFFTTKDTNSGTGLGLAMVYGFVRQSDGDLRIYSELGVGTTIQMTLPRGSELGGREDPMPEDAIKRGNGQTILLVEDELQLLLMITDVVEDLGYTALTAKSGEQALALVEDGEPFDLLLTDVVMPGKIGGFELARRVRDIRPDIPVIYTSGYTGFTASEMGKVQAPLLQKPSPPAELAEVIAQALSKNAS
ncbi:ATP-binding protein [Roseobacter sp. A03A-229]